MNTKKNASSKVQTAVFESLPNRTMMSVSPQAFAHPGVVVGERLPNPGTIVPLASSPVGLTPARVRHAFGLDRIKFGSVNGDGAGQTIAIVDAYDAPTAVRDLQTFDRAFGLPDPSFVKLNQNGVQGNYPRTDPNASPRSSWELEEALDIQWAHAIAPRAKIVLVEANSSSLQDLYKAVDTARKLPGVSAVSMSFGASEQSAEGQLDPIFRTPSGHNGVTFLASSGDSGSANGTGGSTGTSFPASSPNVVAVGGTNTAIDFSGNYLGERAWSGSGGGISRFESRPGYQGNINTGGKRGVPDVAWIADPATGCAIVDSFDLGSSSPWISIGGTSLACPMWAGLIAVANQGRQLAGKGTLDGASQTLPMLYAMPQSNFHDVVFGGNGAYGAGGGYDVVTGRGTPKADLIASYLVTGQATTPPPTIGRGTISGNVFLDLDGSRTFNSSLEGFGNWQVAIDLNRNGRLDSGDVVTRTDSHGHYAFSNVPFGSYVVGEVDEPFFIAVTPGKRTVTLSSSSPNASNVNFGINVSFFAKPTVNATAGVTLAATQSIAAQVFSTTKIDA